MPKLDDIAFVLAAQGFHEEVDKIVGLNKSLAWDTMLWDIHGPHSKRLCGAVIHGDQRRINWLMDRGATATEDDLRKAVKLDNLDLVERLCEAGIEAPPETLLMAVNNNHPEMLEALLQTATSLNWRDEEDTTALIRAVELGQFESVVYLLNAGASPNVPKRIYKQHLHLPYNAETFRTAYARTALDFAASFVEKTQNRIYWLLKMSGGISGYEIHELANAGLLQMG